MKRVVCLVMGVMSSIASVSGACDRSVVPAPSVALAVPVLLDHCAAPAATVLVAPVVDPIVVVQKPLLVPRAVRVFSTRRSMRFVR
jgi:hypothetical protein